MTAIIDIEFDFVSSGLSMGKVGRDKAAVKKATLQIKDPANTKVTGIETSSPLLKARLLEDVNTSDDKMEVEVTLLPGLPPGNVREMVTVHSNLESKPEANLRITGLVYGEYEVTPLAIAYFFNDSAGIMSDSSVELTVINHNSEIPLELLEVKDPDGYLKIEKQTLQAGQRYKLSCILSHDNLPDSSRVNGFVLITTNNPAEKAKEITYRIIKRK